MTRRKLYCVESNIGYCFCPPCNNIVQVFVVSLKPLMVAFLPHFLPPHCLSMSEGYIYLVWYFINLPSVLFSVAVSELTKPCKSEWHDYGMQFVLFRLAMTLLGLLFMNNSQQESIIHICIEGHNSSTAPTAVGWLGKKAFSTVMLQCWASWTAHMSLQKCNAWTV
jgi:hypothetical protein